MPHLQRGSPVDSQRRQWLVSATLPLPATAVVCSLDNTLDKPQEQRKAKH
jgi:hypothetical protein